MTKILFFTLLFVVYSVLGWIIETISCFINTKKISFNRGFLIGPYIPIYGTSALLMILFLEDYKNDLFLLFMMSMIYASIIEYITSYLMEKIFKARWWDYSNYKYNLHGRICLKNSLLFGLAGVLLITYINPIVINLLSMIPSFIFKLLTIFLAIIFLVDLIITIIVVSKLRINVSNINSDSTDEIDRMVKDFLSKNLILNRRIFEAFPKVKFNIDQSDLVINRIKHRLSEIDSYLLDKKITIKKIKTNIRKLKKDRLNKDLIIVEKEKLKNIRRNKI